MLSDPGRRAPGRRHKSLAVRTYRRIAEILVERGSTTMTAALVARICRDAEMKIGHALRADPVFGDEGRRRGAQRGSNASEGRNVMGLEAWSQS